MGKKINTTINRFDDGMTVDPRISNEGSCQILKNFDAHTYFDKLVPNRNLVSGDGAAATSQKQNFAVALRTGSTYSLYALGVKSGAATAEILYKNLTTGAATDLDDANWASLGAAAKYQGSSTSTQFSLFTYYQNQGEIYFAIDKQYISAYDPTGTDDLINQEYDFGSTFSNITEGMVHSKDDIFYVGIDNKIIKKNGAAAMAVALTLPTEKVITSICEYRNFLAIATRTKSGVGNSRVYIWDRDSTLETLAESVDWGEGNLIILEELDGTLVGISSVTATGITAAINNNTIVFRFYSGNSAVVFKEFVDDAGGANEILAFKQKVNQSLYAYLVMTVKGRTHRGIWRIGRNPFTGEFAVSIAQTISNTELANTPCRGFFFVGDYAFTSYTSEDVFFLLKSNSAETYTTAIYESQIFNGSKQGFNSSYIKHLRGISVMHDKLPSAGTVLLAYRIDGATSWTTIFTNSTDDSMFHDAINIESSGATLPEYSEIEFRIESAGGAEITGLTFEEEIIDKRLY